MARYGLVLTQIYPNIWRVIFNFMIKYVDFGLELRMRALRLVLTLKANQSSKSMVYASYRSNALTPLIYEFLYKWGDNFFFIHSKVGSWEFGHV